MNMNAGHSLGMVNYSISECKNRAGPKKVGVFQCQYGGCVPISRVCDGALNCIDGSDESEFICGANR